MSIPSQMCESAGLGMMPAGRESTFNKLERRRKQLIEELAVVNQAIELFKTHPEIPDAFDLLSQIRL